MGRSDNNRGNYNGSIDGEGREMTELVTVELERGEWWLVRNQLRNMAYEWRRTNSNNMAKRCDNVADEVDRQLI